MQYAKKVLMCGKNCYYLQSWLWETYDVMFDKLPARTYNGKVKMQMEADRHRREEGKTMIQIFMTEDGAIHQKDEAQTGAWVALTNPTATEILEVIGKEESLGRIRRAIEKLEGARE